jgi:CheY-like chemotaxis protein
LERYLMNRRLRPIFLVEDNPMDLDLARRAFARRKAANPIEVARDGEEALSWLAQWEAGKPVPLVILLDLKLPKIDGLDVLLHFKNHPHIQSVPVVVLTTSSEEHDIQQAYQRGANSYIVKPVDFDRFIQVVDQIEQYWCHINTPPMYSILPDSE